MLKFETIYRYFDKFRNERGAAVLPLVLVATFIILIVGVGISFIAFIENMTAFSQRRASEAEIAARAGIDDALVRILRDRSFNSGGYDLTLGGATATVTVTVNNNCVETKSNYSCVRSLGKAQNRQKKIQAAASIDPETGRMVVVSMKEVAI
ncbi:MAG: hypothetical protein Q8L57_03635 [bacterium]|nr:hypothetical protein [bacterium]